MTSKPTLDDLAPYPGEDDCTAEALAKHLAAGTWHAMGLVSGVYREAFADGAHPDALKAFAYLNASITESFGVVFLLRQLREHAPEAADKAAAELRAYWEDGALSEWLWEWLTDWQVSTEQLNDIADRKAAELAAQANVAADEVTVSKADLVTYLTSEGDELQVEIEALNRLRKAAGIDQ